MTQAIRVNIRAATGEDVPLLLHLIRELAIFERLGDQAVATPEVLHQSLFGEPRGAAALIAEVGGESAGFALYFHNFSTFLGRPGLYLEDLFVLPAFRGQGVGRELLAHLARLAVARGCGRFEWQVLDWNTSARQFYESLGARPNPGWVSYRLSGEALARLGRAGG